MQSFIVTVRYRTNSGCNAKDVRVDADDMTQAIKIASDKVSRRRGVIRIDGGDCIDYSTKRNADRVDGYDRDDLGESPDY